MITRDIVRDNVLSVIRETSVFLVDAQVNGANRISVKVDKPEGITIDECVHLSRAIEAGLQNESEDFELEVSSPGLTEPFKVMEQYRKNYGRQVDVVKSCGQKLTGILQHADHNGILLDVQTKIRETGQKRFQTVTHPVSLKFEDIKTTKVTITF